jgi:hypothetical protein
MQCGVEEGIPDDAFGVDYGQGLVFNCTAPAESSHELGM